MIEIWVQGHAQTIHNVEGLASGHYDVALTDAGRARTVGPPPPIRKRTL